MKVADIQFEESDRKIIREAVFSINPSRLSSPIDEAVEKYRSYLDDLKVEAEKRGYTNLSVEARGWEDINFAVVGDRPEKDFEVRHRINRERMHAKHMEQLEADNRKRRREAYEKLKAEFGD
jgi:hypothetical protein